MKAILSNQVLRFGTIGIINTVIDIAILFSLVHGLGINVILANIISTTVALCFSFIMNARYTFKGITTPKTIILFLVVTLSGLWILQPFVIMGITAVLTAVIPQLATSKEGLLLIAKLVATAVSLIWNFIGYKVIVFR